MNKKQIKSIIDRVSKKIKIELTKLTEYESDASEVISSDCSIFTWFCYIHFNEMANRFSVAINTSTHPLAAATVIKVLADIKMYRWKFDVVGNYYISVEHEEQCSLEDLWEASNSGDIFWADEANDIFLNDLLGAKEASWENMIQNIDNIENMPKA